LTVWVSTDEGKTWPTSRLVHAGGASYSDLTIGRLGRVHLVFERGTKGKVWGGAVSTAHFPVSWLDKSLKPPPRPDPLSEKIYSIYRHLRGPFEEWWHAE
jgi:hypothetical protein